MAVPFTMPDDQNEVEVLLIQLQALLTKLQIAARKHRLRSQQAQSNGSAAVATLTTTAPLRVRGSSINRQRSESSETAASPAQTTNAIPDLISNLSWLASSHNETQAASALTAMPVRSPRRRRTNSESSNCDKTTKTTTTDLSQDWNKVNCDDDGDDEGGSSDGLLSKIMPATVSSCSFMTAMICFVGWHIFCGR
ncbi:uncharacterized protein LOC115882198 [Sitophilus oryzae]|uniref:Uncharacterized protein LOC115882198 n=1 Tax=Sitophilus oryzae TaxID=7048 RepID=A0A6J2XY02_SITOR|nr:uncharacterized protein LOC115882198 [Sitophilus oryzae]